MTSHKGRGRSISLRRPKALDTCGIVDLFLHVCPWVGARLCWASCCRTLADFQRHQHSRSKVKSMSHAPDGADVADPSRGSAAAKSWRWHWGWCAQCEDFELVECSLCLQWPRHGCCCGVPGFESTSSRIWPGCAGGQCQRSICGSLHVASSSSWAARVCQLGRCVCCLLRACLFCASVCRFGLVPRT